MFSSFSNSAFSMRYHKMVATVVAPYGPNAFDGLDILPRSDIIFDATNITTSSAFITDYNFGFEESTKVSGEFKVTCSGAHSSYRAGYAFKST